MKKILVGVLVLVLVGVVFVYREYNRAPEVAGEQEADAKMKVEELFSKFETDESAANTSYTGKVIEVTGLIKSIQQNDGGYLVMVGEGAMGGHAVFSLHKDSQELVHGITEGDEITVKGLCTGYSDLLGDIQFEDCKIILPED